MARAMSATTMPTSQGVKSSLGGLSPIAIFPSRAYPTAMPETIALQYSALTSIFPSVAGNVMASFHITGTCARLYFGGAYPAWGRHCATCQRGLPPFLHKCWNMRARFSLLGSRTSAEKTTQAQVSPSGLCSGHLSASPLLLRNSWSFESAPFGGILASPRRNDSLDTRSCLSSCSCLAFRAAALARLAATFFGSLTFTMTLSTAVCAGYPTDMVLLLFNVSWFLISAITYTNGASMSKLTVLEGGQLSG